MKVVLLAGGLGTRLSEETSVRPKPMVEIGGRPILWHIMNMYASHGFTDFVIACGYKCEIIKEFFLNFFRYNSDFSVQLDTGLVQTLEVTAPNWHVSVVDTGLNTQTGGRLARLADHLAGERFMCTYGDGVADIDLKELLRFHEAAGTTATLTAVRPPARFGGLTLDGGRVEEFSEKPQTGEGWINGGFFVFEPDFFDYLDGDATVLEREPLSRLAREGKLSAYRHEGFWQPMDTVREKHILENLWEKGAAPWKIW